MAEKSSENKVIKAGIGYTVGNFLLKGLSFLTVPIFSRLLSAADYGIFNSYLAYQTILFLLVGMALHTSLKNAKYKYAQDFGKYNSNCILVMLLSLAVWLCLGNLLYPIYGEMVGFSRVVINLLVLDSFGTALVQFYNAYVGLDYRYTSFLKVSAFNAISNLSISILLILTVFQTDRAVGRILGNALPMIIISVVIIFYFWRIQKPGWNGNYVKFAVGYSLPLIPHGVSQVILSQFDRLMIKSMVGNAEAGIYSFAYNIYMIISVVTSSLDNVWGPWFYEQMEKKDYWIIRRQSSKYAFGMLLLSILIMLGTPELIMILGAREYWDSMYAVIPIVVGGYFVFLYNFPAGIEYYHAKTKYIAVGTMAAAVVNMILNAVCIPRFGYVAAAYTTLVTYLLYFLFHYLMARKIQGEFIFSTKTLACYIVSAMAAGGVVLALIEYWLIRWTLLVIIAMGALVWLEREFAVIEKIKAKIKR